MRVHSRFFALGILLLAAFSLLSSSVFAQDDIALEVLSRINRARADSNLLPLKRSAQLDAAAQGQASDLLQHGAALGHRGSDGSGILDRIKRAGYAGDVYGENWAGYRTLDKTFEFWLSDPPHRKNILNPKYREIGIGVAARQSGGYIIVTDFGARLANPEANPAAPTTAPKKPKPTQTRARPTAKLAARVTSVPPTKKPTRAPTAAPTIAPTRVPTVIQVALESKQSTPRTVPLSAKARTSRATLDARADAALGVATSRGDPIRIWSGGALAAAGALILGLAVVRLNALKPRRRSFRS